MDNLWIVNNILKKHYIVRAYFINNKIGEWLLDLREGIVLNDFKKRFSDIIKKYANEGVPQEPIAKDAPIWVFWGQGESQMPPLVYTCYQSILRNAGEHPVRLLSMENYEYYVELPQYIIDKLDRGIISWATFSDILRVSLLSKWGGIWLDATIYMTRSLPSKMYQKSFYSVGHPAEYGMVRLEPSRCKWRIFLMGCYKDDVIMRWCRDLFYQYEKEFDYNVDYFLLDFFILLGSKQNKQIKKILDTVEQQPMNIYDMQNKLNTAYKQEELIKLKENSFFYKMSYRGDFKLRTSQGEDTFYKVLFRGENDSN